MKNILVLIFAGVLLQGCLGKKNEITEDVVFLQSVPVCNTPEICKKMWDAAGDWVDKYSPQGIETFSDVLIQSEEKEFGSDETSYILYNATGFKHDIWNIEVMRKIADLTEALEKEVPFVKNVTSVTNAELIEGVNRELLVHKIVDNLKISQHSKLKKKT